MSSTKLRVIVPASAAALIVALAACSSAPTGNASPAGNSSPATAPSNPGPPVAFGTIAALSAPAKTMQVQNPQGQTTVRWTASTAFSQTVPASVKDVTTGSCIIVTGAPDASGATTGPITAVTVRIGSEVSGACTPAALLGGNAGGFRFGGGFGRRTRSPRPFASNGRLRPRAAFGKVTAMSGNALTVVGTNPRDGSTTTSTVTLTSTTIYVKTAKATASDLAVGKCAAARGPADETGAITAATISISSPTANGCTGGFGFGGGGGFGGGFGFGGGGNG